MSRVKAVRESAPGAVSRYEAVIVGGGIAGLAAAWELVQAGLRPLLVEARGYTGGLVARGEVAGVPMDLGAEGFVLRGTAVSEIAAACGLEVVPPQGGGAHLFLPPPPPSPSRRDRRRLPSSPVDPPSPGTAHDPAGAPAGSAGTVTADITAVQAGGWALHRFPADAFLGIPAVPQATDVVSIIGAAGAQRAAADAEMGGLAGTGPQDPADLASFVRRRMGDAVLDRLVRPIVAGIHTADPADLAADTVAPGLRAATRSLGSLQAAVAEVLARRRARTGGRTVDVTTRGGLSCLTQAMREAVEAAGGQVRTRTGAQHLRRTSDGAAWELELTPTGPGPTPSAEPVPTGEAETARTPLVVLACSAAPAQRLLADAGVDARLAVPAGSPVARLTVVVHAPGLATAPVGSGLLVAPAEGDQASRAPVTAKALSHLSVKWPWVGQALRRLHGPGTHALRLSYGRPGEPRPEVTLSSALADVETLTGVRIEPAQVIDHRLVRWDGTLPPVSAAYRARAAQAVARAEARPGLGLTGAWVAGTGVAAVVAHARDQAARLAGSLRQAGPGAGTAPGNSAGGSTGQEEHG